MLRKLQFTLTALSLCALLGFAQPNQSIAATILEMNLADATTDIEYSGGTLHTVDDNDGNPPMPPGPPHPATTGQQNTGVQFLNFIDGYAPDIVMAPFGSLTLSGLTPSPGPNSALLINGFTVIQNFSGGTLQLWDQNNVLLLSGTLGQSALTGALGNAAGGLFQTSFGTISPTSALYPYVDPSSFLMSMNFTSIKTIPGGQTGLTLVAPLPPGPPPLTANVDILPFRADAAIDVEANPVPEPTTAMLLVAVAVNALTLRRRIAG